MTSNALVQTRIDSDVKDRATAVLENMGLTVSDADFHLADADGQ